MNRKLYEVVSPPDTIVIGRRTETGVMTIRIDCTGWLTFWPSLVIGLWVTPPGGEAYTASTYMDGNVLVWPITDDDTARAGWGTVELVGEADGLGKLSGAIKLVILQGGQG